MYTFHLRSMIEEEDNTANNDSANTAIQEVFFTLDDNY